MKSLCLFASYVDRVGLPYYVTIYLSELKKYSNKLIYIHSNELDSEALNFFIAENIETLKVENEGFDFGKWKKALKSVDLLDYDELFLVNDSSVLYASLYPFVNWFRENNIDFGGLTESSWPQRHIQSYFLGFKKNTFEDLKQFFDDNNPSNSITEVIQKFEIGLSHFLLNKNYQAKAFLSNDGYIGEYAPYYNCLLSHINQGTPMIKKKVLFSSYRKSELFTLARMNFNINVRDYIKLIQEKNLTLIISFDDLLKHEKNRMSLFHFIKYNITRFLIQIYRKLKK